MAIITHVKEKAPDFYQYSPPDQFVSDKKKQSDDFIKNNLDYFSTVANAQFFKNATTFIKNYNLVKGILTREDFYQEVNKYDELKSFTDTVLGDIELPAHVKHYSILNPPMNILIGEQSKRPDTVKIKAYDDDSRDQELSAKTQLTQQELLSVAQEIILLQSQMSGSELTEEELMQQAMAKIEDQLTGFTSLAERWGNRVLDALKVEFNYKELSEEAFRDLLICAREYYHIYEDNSKTGFGAEVLNPKNVWNLTLPDRKYTSDPSGKNQGAYASGTIRIMEIGEIMERFSLTKEEIDHLRKGLENPGNISARPSLYGTSRSGENTIEYDTYSPLLAQERMLVESMLAGGDPNSPADFFGMASNAPTSFGNKFVVVEGYWLSKKKIAELVYIDREGQEQTTFVDETYETIPNEVSIDWGWINQWYWGARIGSEVYHCKPFELLDYNPIIGVIHENKNVSDAKSFVDLMKPLQIIYNVLVNQLWKLLEKDLGVQYVSSMRKIPTLKDGDNQDALDVFMEVAKSEGLMLEDDSPENMKAPSSNTQVARAINLSRADEMRARYELARGIKAEAWELSGITAARAGGILATQTATATQTELTQSYAQTEPYFVQHEYVNLQFQQALIDAAMYIETKKPYSTISYISNEGDDAFIRVNSNELSLRDLKVFPTSRPQDIQMFQELKQLAQPMLQNGATPYDISVLYTTNSVRQMKQIFKSLADKQEQYAARQQELAQGELQTKQAEIEATLQAAAEQAELERNFEATENELDRLSKKEIAIINTYSRQEDNTKDADMNGTPDILEISRLSQEGEAMRTDNNIRTQELNQKRKADADKREIELEKIRVEKERMQNDLKMQKAELESKAKDRRAARAKANKKK